MSLSNSANNGKRHEGPAVPKAIVSASILDCNKAQWGDALQLALDAECEWLHFDVMDGHFVPPISFGPMVIGNLRKTFPGVFFDCHFMVTEPEKFVPQLRDLCPGPAGFTFHIEATEPRGTTKATIQQIRDAGMRVGIALSPETPVDAVLPYAGDVDLVLVMTVRPGYGGQSFMTDTMSKVRALRELHPTLDIQVDGGLKPGKTSEEAAAAGANVIVSGSGLYGAPDVKKAAEDMLQALQRATAQ